MHDSLKFRVRNWLPKTGENHHAMRARRLAERYTDDERLLATIELHDRPYGLWRRRNRTGRDDDSAFDSMLERIPDIGLFSSFVDLDGSTEGKNPRTARVAQGRVTPTRGRLARRRSPRQPGSGRPQAAGVAAGTWPAASPATMWRTAARATSETPPPPICGTRSGARVRALAGHRTPSAPRRYSPSVENSTMRSSAGPIRSLN